MKTIIMREFVDEFAEDKDKARSIRTECITPALENGEEVVIDFEGISLLTQSFVHALISDVMREYGIDVLDRLFFKNCNEASRASISLVVDYMQWGNYADED